MDQQPEAQRRGHRPDKVAERATRSSWVGLWYSANMDMLVTHLQAAKESFSVDGQQFETAVASLVAVTDFLNAEPAIAGQGLTEPLRCLGVALTQLLNSSPDYKQLPPLLQQRRAQQERQHQVSENMLKGAILAWIDILHGRRVAVPTACDLLSKELNHHGITYRKEALEQLRDSIGRRSKRRHKLVDDVRQQLRNDYLSRPLSPEIGPKDVASQLVTGFVIQYVDVVGMRGRLRGRIKRA